MRAPTVAVKAHLTPNLLPSRETLHDLPLGRDPGRAYRRDLPGPRPGRGSPRPVASAASFLDVRSCRIEDEACAYVYALTGIFTRGRASGRLTRRFVPGSGVPGFPADVPELLLPVDRPVVLLHGASQDVAGPQAVGLNSTESNTARLPSAEQADRSSAEQEDRHAMVAYVKHQTSAPLCGLPDRPSVWI